MESKLQCSVCNKTNCQSKTKLGIPICLSCWKADTPCSYFDESFPDDDAPERDMDRITQKVFLGNEIGQKSKAILKALGVTHILIMGAELQIYHPEDFICLKLNIKDYSTEDISKYFEETYNFIEQAKGNVYVHCFAGVSRSATIVIAYMMKKENMSFDEALNFVKKIRLWTKPNYGFITQLREYGKQLKVEMKRTIMENDKTCENRAG